MRTERYDLVVIGSGPAGEKGAVTAALLGKRVAMVEKSPFLGGAQPTPAPYPARPCAKPRWRFPACARRKLYGVDLSIRREATIADLMYHERHVKTNERERIRRNLSAHHHVELIRGEASFVDPHTISVSPSHDEGTPDHGEVRLPPPDVLLIATGSSPVQPPEFPFKDHRVHDSDEILHLDQLPRTLAVVGAGVMGSEYACTFAALGVKVWVIDGRDELLSVP